ncbi:phospholipase D-like domain-containing protein [Sphingopyxis sp. MWB1]|uniref:phospholipase D-like domain-containing protein n=1 Tax=Sphingopyxis sp. MWB1 TaxID=1537715 RepID=UPI00051A0D8E|nr:phospholipase D-like domain-containing protein [Sphingopyxis sp. MWB1]
MTAPSLPFALGDTLIAQVAEHRLEIIPGGEARFKRLLQLIDGAKHSIDLIMYIFQADEAGAPILEALVRAARRGVRVRAIIDSFGSADTSDASFEPLRAAGGNILFFSRKWRSSYLIRNHQKLLVIDDEIAVSGGFNIAAPYLSDDRSDCWFDLGLIVQGPSVRQMTRWFQNIHDYCRDHDGKLLMLRRLIRRWPVDQGALTWLVGGPTERLSPWARTLRHDMENGNRLNMAMAYFSPGQGMLRRLGRLARRGEARFVMAGQSDNAATIGASRLLYGYLLRKGAAVWEYRACRLHMKLIVIDDIVYIGTANFDMRSLFLNVELMLRVVDADFAAQMRDFILNMKNECNVLTPASHRARAGWLTRLRWALAWFVVGVADYTVTRRLNFGLTADPETEL